MGLLSFLKRKPADARPAKASPAPAPESADAVQQARLRARQRLIGAVVLVTAGVIGFSLLFESQPRPLPIDTPIELARKENSSTPPAPARSPNKPAPGMPSGVITETPAEAGREVAASAPAAAASPAVAVAAKPEPAAPSVKPVEPKPAKPEPKPEPKPTAKPPADGARAQALLEGKKPAAAAEGRFIVQVGAFSEVAAAREARQKVEKLGLKTYTQVVETSSGNRIRVRVGPFASRDEADKAAGKIKSAGLPSAVYTL